MTAIPYPDLEAFSPNGRLRVEAKSPDNGEVPWEDGSVPERCEIDRSEYWGHQSGFRYRLVDVETGNIVWERWQEEFSPQHLYVDDSGWTVAITHCWMWRDEVIAIDPSGKRVLLVTVSSSDLDTDLLPESELWIDPHPHGTTAGLMWLENSLSYFFTEGDRTHFAIRPWWGRRLVLDLEQHKLLSDQEVEKEYSRKCGQVELALAMETLQFLSTRFDELKAFDWRREDDLDLVRHVERWQIASYLAASHGERSALAILLQLEQVGLFGCESSTVAFRTSDYRIIEFYSRPVVQCAIRALGGLPSDAPAYGFRKGEFPIEGPARSQRSLEDIESARKLSKARAVLDRLGSPDFIRDVWHEETSIRTEHWYFDFPIGGTDGGEISSWRCLEMVWRSAQGKGYPKVELAEVTELRAEDLLQREGLIGR